MRDGDGEGFVNKRQKVALYARVSTTSGHQDPGAQLLELREYAKARGWSIEGEYVDRMSGGEDSRPHLDRLMRAAWERRVDIILCWKLDRWGRSLRHLVNSVADLEALGVAFCSLKDAFDTTTPSGRLQFQILGAMAEFERNLIRERVKMGLRNARAKGKRLGRPRRVLPLGKIQIMRANGATLREIGRRYHVSPALLCRELKRRDPGDAMPQGQLV
jgi:putative DNA-invertase from lambdoid prophage Rac